MTENRDQPETQVSERQKRGLDWFEYVMAVPAPTPDSAFRGAGIVNFVFSEMWSRPNLDMRARRWITLACVGATGAQVPIETHVYAALKSGDVTLEEIREFVLHFAVYCGWPRASVLEQAVRDAWDRVVASGGPERDRTPPSYRQQT